MQKKTKLVSINILSVLAIIIFLSIYISCASFQKVTLKDYSNIETSTFERSNITAYEGVEIAIPEAWMFLPPDKENQILKFISPDAKKTGILEIFVEEYIVEKVSPEDVDDSDDMNETPKNEDNRNTNEADYNNIDNKNNADNNGINETENHNENDEPTDEDTSNDDDLDGETTNNKAGENQNEKITKENPSNEENNNDNETNRNIELKPLSEYLTDLLKDKKNNKYRMGWYVKRYDDKAKGYLTKMINKEADFLYYAFFIDEREPRRIIRLLMFETNENKPNVSGGINASFSVPDEDVQAVDDELFTIFKSVSIKPERETVSKSRYNFGLSIERGWKPYYDDTQNNILFFLHKTNKSAIQMRKIGYKYSQDKEQLIKALIFSYQEQNPDYIYEEDEININNIECKVLNVSDYVSEYFENAPLTLKKIFIPYDDEIYEASIIYNNENPELSESIDVIVNNISLIGE